MRLKIGTLLAAVLGRDIHAGLARISAPADALAVEIPPPSSGGFSP
jgi:hypothetical protein